MKALVTGGGGFLGSNLCADLLAKGYEMAVVDNFSTGCREHIAPFESSPRFSFHEMGIESPAFRDKFLGKKKWRFDEVYHLACPTGVPNIAILGEEMVDACSVGTKNVVEVALGSDAKLVFTSSCEVYGDPEVSPQHEDYTGNVHPQGSRANYEEGKRFSETILKLYVAKYGLKARTARLFNIYGPKMNVTDQRVIPVFMQAALAGKPLPVNGNGKNKRTLCYVADLIRGLQCVIRKGVDGGIYNIGSDKDITILDLARKIIEITGSKSAICFADGLVHDHKARMPELKKIHDLGWKREVELEEGLVKTAEYFKLKAETRL